jgi:hypothetical protein
MMLLSELVRADETLLLNRLLTVASSTRTAEGGALVAAGR